MERTNAWTTYSPVEMEKCQRVNESYMDFLSVGKTERECVTEAVRQAREAGYIFLEERKENKKPLAEGEKIYAVCMKKAIALFHIGKDSMAQGMNILGAHIDSPRLDVKQNPLYE